MKNLVMLDLGSNSTRMSINQVDDKGNFTEVKRMKQMTRMAEGMGASGTKKLEDKAIERTLNALRDFQKEYQNMPNLTVRGIATAAVRSAENSLEFLERVKELTGVDIEVLSGSAEAYYDYVGVINSLNVRDCVICDMGGGSFELAVVVDKEAVSYVSIPYGAVMIKFRRRIFSNFIDSFCTSSDSFRGFCKERSFRWFCLAGPTEPLPEKN